MYTISIIGNNGTVYPFSPASFPAEFVVHSVHPLTVTLEEMALIAPTRYQEQTEGNGE